MVNANLTELERDEERVIAEYFTFQYMYLHCRKCSERHSNFKCCTSIDGGLWKMKLYDFYNPQKLKLDENKIFCICDNFLGEQFSTNVRPYFEPYVHILKSSVEIKCDWY